MKHYIIYMGDVPQLDDSTSILDIHHDTLASIKGSHEEAKASIRYRYTKSFNGFSAMLTEEEANRLAATKGVVSIFINRRHKLLITRSWDFVGLNKSAPRVHAAESDIIIGVIDSGIDPSVESLNGDNFGPPPAKWKGSCFANFTCNNKVVGAKIFPEGKKYEGDATTEDVYSPMDLAGHGTSVASIAAGNWVDNANLFGIANGTARGAVPGARIAMYKVCWRAPDNECYEADILKAMDEAIADGVDILSISLVVDDETGTFDGGLSIGTFHAMKKGILSVAGAGNDGPGLGTVRNCAPWILTVGMTNTDRQLKNTLLLGNGQKLEGEGAINVFKSPKNFAPLITSVDSSQCDFKDEECRDNAGTCYFYMDSDRTKGKILLCKIPPEAGMMRQYFKRSHQGIVGSIWFDTVPPPDLVENPYVLSESDGPQIGINRSTTNILLQYLKSNKSAVGKILQTESIIGGGVAPIVSSGSCRGPDRLGWGVLKPDVVAPGENILLAIPSYKTYLYDTFSSHNRPTFSFGTGTSFATPHVGGVAAYIKSFHPTWSPAAIKSAITTTTTPAISVQHQAEFAYGAGMINPVGALNPGLVYDMNETDYSAYLCRLGISPGKAWDNSISPCSSFPQAKGTDGLNYPTIQLTVNNTDGPFEATFERTVTNVDDQDSVYTAKVEAPQGINITVSPQNLSFNTCNKTGSFQVKIMGNSFGYHRIASGALIWSDSVHNVRSPIVIHSVKV
ncbi:subtilisin-like protease SBT4.14 isoform X1 [Amborella trichopoda]|uniref:subtilisin-like protease SBT4.14 isoform X1 n=1 Tax=Amborella trichopoda TaxID=13333 RepID=UPI0009C070F6|nr:subtilisin-like protease SBT4.14 isoform X1 [Amborella trichopoda]|eukprot:XP_020531458.1 subtilisin-like protease SBT4.14 isoform X1 [Amborella trichopoda]